MINAAWTIAYAHFLLGMFTTTWVHWARPDISRLPWWGVAWIWTINPLVSIIALCSASIIDTLAS